MKVYSRMQEEKEKSQLVENGPVHGNNLVWMGGCGG